MQKLRNGRAYHDGFDAYYNHDLFCPWPRGDLRRLKWEKGWSDACLVHSLANQVRR
jgi:hypothetical protein